MAAKLKKGDTVIVLTGKDKGREGEITTVMPKDNKVIVSGINMVKRHTKPSQMSNGGIISKEAPLHISNVALKDPKSGKPTRVGFKIDGERKVRVAKNSGEVIDG
ncbi:MAG: 50S ribosomal protein L24 [bacterium]